MKKILGTMLVVMSIVLPVATFALTVGPGTTAPASGCTPGAICNPIKYATFSDFVAAVTKTAVEILLPFVVIAFIYSGFLFVRAQGNADELEKAKSSIWWSIIGAFILLGAWGFAQVIGETVSTITTP